MAIPEEDLLTMSVVSKSSQGTLSNVFRNNQGHLNRDCVHSSMEIARSRGLLRHSAPGYGGES